LQTHTLVGLFQNKLFRIPDYQRGYAWGEHQIKDFWEDILQLHDERMHYTGVLTLEPLNKERYAKWEEDIWLIENKGFKPYYVVDGQQRLTTALVLIQAILESVPQNMSLNFTTISDIERKFIIEQHNSENESYQSYIFGYEKDNPSDEYLRTKIFNKRSTSNNHELTLYTKNLYKAKSFFLKELQKIEPNNIEKIYYKLTQKMKYSIYEIEADIDINVAFETMNNRGKALTTLEKLKNRLIYLTTLFSDQKDNGKLREDINNVWKTIYQYLGRNKDQPLDEDQFLRNHWIMYYNYSRNKGNVYIDFLLDEAFTSKRILQDKESALTREEITEYIHSLQKSIKYWFYIHNPNQPYKTVSMTGSQVEMLEKLNSLSFKAFKPLILSAYTSDQNPEKITELLKEIERYNFCTFSLSKRRSNTGDTEFYRNASELLNGSRNINSTIENIRNWCDDYFSKDNFLAYIQDKYELHSKEGFYRWDDIRYFLYEYEQNLKKKSMSNDKKLNWDELNKYKKDYVSIEHIYPQNDSDKYWQDRFIVSNNNQKNYLLHSIGNLLALSCSKNSSLQNISFNEKKSRINSSGNLVGFVNGSFSEIDVAQHQVWTPIEILQRGLDMLDFMEKRWDIVLGDNDFKKKLLHLEFLD
jgi:uncharacterized protein with ParB-like and HNH nuclease domain